VWIPKEWRTNESYEESKFKTWPVLAHRAKQNRWLARMMDDLEWLIKKVFSSPHTNISKFVVLQTKYLGVKSGQRNLTTVLTGCFRGAVADGPFKRVELRLACWFDWRVERWIGSCQIPTDLPTLVLKMSWPFEGGGIRTRLHRHTVVRTTHTINTRTLIQQVEFYNSTGLKFDKSRNSSCCDWRWM